MKPTTLDSSSQVGGIKLSHLTKVFDDGTCAVDDVELTIDAGEFIVLVGPSGCGKTTLLRMIAGLEEVTDGTIEIGGRDVTDLPPRERDIAMVFQTYALYPHMNVRKNLGYGLKMRGTRKEEIDRRVQQVATMLGLEALLDRRPAALSGGQRQRVAMGRAVVREPAAFLMDEPLSNLDAKLRVAMRTELARLHERLGITTVYVTHDQVEAMTLGQRVAVMREGVVQQVDTPSALYDAPVNIFVAGFIGSPAMNFAPARVEATHVAFGGLRLPLDPLRRPPLEGEVVLGIRPHALEDARFSSGDRPTIEVTPAVVELLGSEIHVIFALETPRLDLASIAAANREADDNAAALIADDRRSLVTAQIDPRSRARVGKRLALTVNPSMLHFFDPRTGLSLL